MTAQLKQHRSNKKDHIKNKSQYQLYEEDLSNYKSRSRSKLQQWDLMQSQFLGDNLNYNSKASHLPNIHNKNSVQKTNSKSPIGSKKFNKEVTFNKDNHKQDGGDQLRSPKSSRSIQNKDYPNAYTYKVKQNFEGDYEKKTSEDLQKQLKNMREMLIQLNKLVSSKLNKYQLAVFTPKGMAVVSQPQKQQEILKAKIANNSRIIQALQKQIRQIQQKDKELQQKDYLIELQQSANLIMNNIRSKRKQKTIEGVAVQKLDGKLIQMRQAELDDQFKMVKVIKHNILYYFKKFNEQKAIIDELDKNYKQLVSKDEKLIVKYNQMVKMAEVKNMLVTSNKNYLENKKMQDDLLVKVDQAKKKIQVYKKANATQCEKMQKQIQKMKKQALLMHSKSQQAGIACANLGKLIQENIQKNQIGKKLINSISYKFAQVLIKYSLKDSSRNTPKQSLQGVSDIKPDVVDKSKLYIKPMLKKNKQQHKVNLSAQITPRYQTLDLEEAQQKLNDKNVQTINFETNKSKEFRIKPSMHIKKKSQNQSKIMESVQINNQVKADETQLIYKPKRFQKILSLKKSKQTST